MHIVGWVIDTMMRVEILFSAFLMLAAILISYLQKEFRLSLQWQLQARFWYIHLSEYNQIYFFGSTSLKHGAPSHKTFPNTGRRDNRLNIWSSSYFWEAPYGLEPAPQECCIRHALLPLSIFFPAPFKSDIAFAVIMIRIYEYNETYLQAKIWALAVLMCGTIHAVMVYLLYL